MSFMVLPACHGEKNHILMLNLHLWVDLVSLVTNSSQFLWMKLDRVSIFQNALVFFFYR